MLQLLSSYLMAQAINVSVVFSDLAPAEFTALLQRKLDQQIVNHLLYYIFGV